VIDSGVNVQHPHIISRSTNGVALESGAPDADWEDQVGHGTAVTAAIQEKAPDAEYYVLKLFGPSLRATAKRLIDAVEWAVHNRMNLINLSLGTTNFEHEGALKALVEKALQAECFIVSARVAGESLALPGALDGVICVDLDWNLPRNQYQVRNENGRRVFVASGFPRSLPGVPPSRNLHGASFAVANMTGFVARAIEYSQALSFEALCDVLAVEAAQ
jgi:subtilisin family serine protease